MRWRHRFPSVARPGGGMIARAKGFSTMDNAEHAPGPVRVCHIITGLSMGGAEAMLLKLLEGLGPAARGSAVVSMMDRGALGSRIESLGIQIVELGMRPGVPTLAGVWRLRQAMHAIRPEVVQGWMYHGNLAALLARRFCPGRLPVVWDVQHSVYSLGAEKLMTAAAIRLGALLSSRAAAIVYPSAASARQHEVLGYERRLTRLIPNGFDTDRFRPSGTSHDAFRAQLGLATDDPVIGLVARYHPMKDHGTFLRAAALVAQERPDAHFVLAGPGVEATNMELATLIDTLGLEARVRLLGPVTDAPGLMASLDVLCSSSSSESFPNVIGEAMSTGVPCVVTDVGECARIIGETGVAVPPRNPERLAAGLLELLALPPALRHELGTRARDRIVAEYSLHSVCRQFQSLYAELTRG